MKQLVSKELLDYCTTAEAECVTEQRSGLELNIGETIRLELSPGSPLISVTIGDIKTVEEGKYSITFLTEDGKRITVDGEAEPLPDQEKNDKIASKEMFDIVTHGFWFPNQEKSDSVTYENPDTNL